MLARRLSVEQARSQYLRVLIDSRQPSTSIERDIANRAVKKAAQALQQAQLTQRLQKASRAGIARPSDWNLEEH